MVDTISLLGYHGVVANKDEKTASLLVSLGLSEKEADVYLALLELGKATVSHIGRKTGINRTTVYSIVDSLSGKGLVSISGKEPKEEYAAEAPDNLIEFLKEKHERAKARIQKTETDIEKAGELLPYLKSIHRVENRPHVRFYDGTDGLKYVYEDTLASNTEGVIRAFASFEDMEASLGTFYPTYIKRRAKSKISSRGIVPSTPESRARKKRDAEEYRELVLLPEEKPSLYPEIDIYGDRVMIASEKEKLGIIIESADIALAMKKMFDLAWERGKQLEKNPTLGVKNETV